MLGDDEEKHEPSDAGKVLQDTVHITPLLGFASSQSLATSEFVIFFRQSIEFDCLPLALRFDIHVIERHVDQLQSVKR